SLSTPGEPMAGSLRRFVQMEEQFYEAHVYGRRLGQRTKYKIALHGIAIGPDLALHEFPVRMLEAEELAAAPPISVRECPVCRETQGAPTRASDLAGDGVWLAVGGTV